MAEVSLYPEQHEVLIERGVGYYLDAITYDEVAKVWRGQVTMRQL
jgi:hypothetical protein